MIAPATHCRSLRGWSLTGKFGVMARIVLNTFGSLGDLHPYLAIALELQRRGHQPVVATHGLYRARIEAMALEFAPVRPHGETWGQPAGVIREAMDAKRGSQV